MHDDYNYRKRISITGVCDELIFWEVLFPMLIYLYIGLVLADPAFKYYIINISKKGICTTSLMRTVH
jgi:hypothetical protein